MSRSPTTPNTGEEDCDSGSCSDTDGWGSFFWSQITPVNYERVVDEAPVGPKYPELEDSLVLYNPESDKFHEVDNPNGFVPVVVHPDLVSGKNSSYKQPLSESQVDGIRFMWKCYMDKQGCILAHEMGLGKTRAAIVLIMTALEQCKEKRVRSFPGAQKVIVIAPKNAVPVWEHELNKWKPESLRHFEKRVIYSHQRDSQALKILEEFADMSRKEVKLLILSYNSFTKYVLNIRALKEAGLQVDMVVCDEAHLLKNDGTYRCKVIKNFKVFDSSTVWIGLTGTPYQNTVEEYANLIQFFRPGTLEVTYKKTICDPIMNYYKKHKELDSRTHELLVHLREKSHCVVQYRCNNLNVERNELIVCLQLNPGPVPQEKGLAMLDLQHLLYEELCQNEKPMKELPFYNRLDLLTKLCIHPLYACQGSIQRKKKEGGKKEIKYEDLDEFQIFKKELDILKNLPSKNSGIASRKVAFVVSTVLQILRNSEEEKIVIASNSKYLLDTIETALNAHKSRKRKMSSTTDGPDKNKVSEQLQFHILRYDGGCSHLNRKNTLTEFETQLSSRVLLLGSKAGGTALTLTQANHLFLLDPDWNPANDRQTIGRVNRHGQQKPIFIYRILCTGTIEETKFMYQLTKEELDKFFKTRDESNASDVGKVHLPFGAQNLCKYYPESKSRIYDLLEKHKANAEEYDDEFEVRRFAEELNHNSMKYAKPPEVPADLKALSTVWTYNPSMVSFVFHQKKSMDTLSSQLI